MSDGVKFLALACLCLLGGVVAVGAAAILITVVIPGLAMLLWMVGPFIVIGLIGVAVYHRLRNSWHR